MTVRVESMRLTCDYRGCPRTVAGYQSSQVIRRYAAMDGWTTEWNENDVLVDVCPDHRRKGVEG